MRNSQTVVITIMITVLMANGIGARTLTVVSVSTPARATRSPSGRRRCHVTGCSTSWSSTWFV